jgi:hypothetical protein
MRNGHIESYVPLDDSSDEALTEQAMAEFEKVHSRYDGFEVWPRERLLYCSPPVRTELTS